MPNEDFMPPKHDEFHTWQQHFLALLAASPAKFGVTTQDLTPVTAVQAIWAVAHPAQIQAQKDAETKTVARDDCRAKFEPLLRGLAQKVHGTPGMTNAIRAEAWLPERGGPRTSIAAPTTRPLGRIEVKPNYTLVLHFVDEETPQRLAKPQGVQGCQIWSAVGGEQPKDPSGYAFIALDTRTPYADEHAHADAGKTVYYLLRWQNAKGETGPWSDVVTGKVPG